MTTVASPSRNASSARSPSEESLQRLQPRDEVEAAVLQRVRQLVSEKRVLEQGFRREAERGGTRRRLGRALGDDEELLLGGIVEAGDLARVESRELLLEDRLGVEESDGREGGRVARERRGQVLDELLAENAQKVLLGEERRRHVSRERDAPDLLDELLRPATASGRRSASGRRGRVGAAAARRGRREDRREKSPAAGPDR